jgi:hypothetical protein
VGHVVTLDEQLAILEESRRRFALVVASAKERGMTFDTVDTLPPTIYDVSIDETRPATQADVDALMNTAARYVRLRRVLLVVAVEAKLEEKDISPSEIEMLISNVTSARPAREETLAAFEYQAGMAG